MFEATRKENKEKDYLPKIFFLLQIIFGIWISFWILFNHQPKTGDDVEHLHSAWLVFQGEIPYKDFFQHHNPLLWYLFAPLVGIFAYDIVIFDIVRIISTIIMFLTLMFVAKITSRYLTQSKYAGLLAIVSVFPSYIIFSGQDFRPDNYMVFSFICGLYYFFAYLDNKNRNYLILSFFLMFLTFMFMQKSIFFLAVFGICVLFLLYKKEIAIKDFLISLIIPSVGAIFFLSWLIYHDMLKLYWQSNFIFNLYIPDVYGGLVEPTKTEFYVLTFIAMLGCAYYLWKGNIAARIICILWISEAIQRFFYFSLDRHYYYFLDILDAILAGGVAWQIIHKWRWGAYVFVVLCCWSMVPFKAYCKNNKLLPMYHRYVTPKYVVEQTNKCDSVLNGYGLTYGIFTKDITYYWNLNGQLDVIGDKIGIAPLPDLNEAVEKYLPHIIYTAPFWNEKLHKQGRDVAVHFIDPRLRDKYYEQSLFMDMFILKPQYQKIRRCRYDAKTNSWSYYYKE